MSAWSATFLGRDPLASLLEQAREGNEQAFVELYRQLYPSVWAMVSRRIREHARAEDVVARTFHQFLESIDSFAADRGTVRAWTLSIARNLVIDEARARSASPESAADQAGIGPVEQQNPLSKLLLDEDLRELSRQLDRLDPEARELLVLRLVDGLRHAEVAQVLGISVAAAKQRFSRALRELRQQLRGPARMRGLP